MLSNMPPKANPQHINGELEAIHKLIQDIKTDLAGKATTKKLIELSNEIRLRDSKIEVLESKVAVLQNTVDLLVNKCDNNEQYSRRCSLRINNVPLPDSDNESADDVFEKVKGLIEECELDIPDNVIDRAHRVGKQIMATDGTRKQQVIVRFTTWRHRSMLYKNRKKLSNAKVYIDLTRMKFSLLKKAQDKVKNSNVIDYVFADLNCALCAKMSNGSFKFFSTEEHLDVLLGNN